MINPVIYAELSTRYTRIEELHAAASKELLEREPVLYEAAFLAAKAFQIYRERGGTKRSTVPDFYIGAHAAVAGYRLLTRDTARYRTYFSALQVIAPS